MIIGGEGGLKDGGDVHHQILQSHNEEHKIKEIV